MRTFRRRRGSIACTEVGRILQHHLDCELDEQRAATLAAHLENCSRCGMEADTYSQINATLERRRGDRPSGTVARLRPFGENLTHHDPSPAS